MEYEYKLSKTFNQHVRQETTVAEIANILNCSTRYAKTIIHALQAEGKIRWETTRGRGKKPNITMNRSSTDIFMEWLDQLWSTGKNENAIELAKQENELTNPIIQQWLNTKIGVQTIKDEHVFIQPMYPVKLDLNPLTAISRHDLHFIEQIHETLFLIDENGEVTNNLVFHYETKNYINWTFILRKGITFHDGSILTTDDVIISLHYIHKHYSKIVEVQSIEKITNYEFTIQLKESFSMLPTLLASKRFAIMPKSLNYTIGCGPFKLTKLTDEKIVLETFTHYFKERPWIDRVELLITENEEASVIHYKPFEHAPYRIIENIEEGATYCILNSNREAFRNDENRAFLWHFIDPEAFVLTREREFEAYGWFTKCKKLELAPYEGAIPTFNQPLIIGYQQIRAEANHLPQAQKLREILYSIGIECELKCIDFQGNWPGSINEVDIFVGGSALSKNYILSFFIYYATYGSYLFSAMDDNSRRKALALYEEAKTSTNPMQQFQQIEYLSQETYHMKFLKHRKHYYYVREQSTFADVEFDDYGRINYRKLFVSTDTPTHE